MNKTIKTTLGSLRTAMVTEYLSVNDKRNPFAVELEKLTCEELLTVVTQYAIFPSKIVSFLLASRKSAKLAGWNDVAVELSRNIGEELGTETDGVPHYNMLTRGISKELGRTPSAHDIEHVWPTTSTAIFVATMEKIMRDPRPAYVAGATYALESSAIPELQIVLALVDRLVLVSTGSGLKRESELAKFFALHLEVFEVGHELGLRKTLESAIAPESASEVEEGFREVMVTMDAWWTKLYQEIVNEGCLFN